MHDDSWMTRCLLRNNVKLGGIDKSASQRLTLSTTHAIFTKSCAQTTICIVSRNSNGAVKKRNLKLVFCPQNWQTAIRYNQLTTAAYQSWTTRASRARNCHLSLLRSFINLQGIHLRSAVKWITVCQIALQVSVSQLTMEIALSKHSPPSNTTRNERHVSVCCRR